jgi:PAS domain S-box-containing protein
MESLSLLPKAMSAAVPGATMKPVPSSGDEKRQTDILREDKPAGTPGGGPLDGACGVAHRETTVTLPGRLRPILQVLLLLFLAATAFGEVTPARSIRLVLDNNYPPFVFKDSDGDLQGLLIDQWRLWEKKTGIRVEISAMDWGEALRRMKAGDFDVIDTVFQTQERNAYLDFSQPYARIEVPIFFRKDISGITDIDSLKGFPVAAKEGDAAVDLLKQNGIDTVLLFRNYESIIDAARQHKVNVFVMDKPPALYFLNKQGIQTEFRHSAPVNVGEFHRAVRKGNPALLQTIEQGFAAFSPAESKQLEEKWYGVVSNGNGYLQYAAYVGVAALLLAAALMGWNWMLRRMVKRRTAAMEASQAALRESERNYREIFNATNDAIFMHDPRTGAILDVNQTGLTMFGYRLEDIPRLTIGDLSPSEPPYGMREGLEWIRRAVEQGPQVFEWRCKRKEGQLFWAEVGLRSTCIGSAHRVLAVLRDISLRKEHEQEIERLNRLYAVLSQVDQAIVRMRSREELFAEICRGLVEFGGFTMAWVGWLNPETHEVTIAVHHGDTSGFLHGLRVYADDRPEGQGATGVCMREGRAYISNDFFHDPRTGPWREAAVRAGFHASAAFPIRRAGAVCGALTIYAQQVGFFGEKELALLEEAASDVSFAIDHLDAQAEHRRAEEALRRSETSLAAAQAQAKLGNWELNLYTQGGFWSEEMFRLHGRDPALGTPSFPEFLELLHPEDRQLAMESQRRMLDAQEPLRIEFRSNPARGPLRYFNTSLHATRDSQGRVVQLTGTTQDITELKQKEKELQTFRFSIDKASDAVFWMSRDAGFSYVNDEACRSLGYTREELLKLRLWDIDPVYPKERWDAEWKQFNKKGQIGGLIGETFHRRKNGVVFPVEVVSKHIWFGEIELHVAFVRDITERKQAEALVEQSRTQLRALLAQLQRLREEERTRIAREVHDVLGQMLTGLKMDMAWCERRFPQIADERLRQSLAEKLASTSQLLDTMIESVQKISRELRPSVLDNIGLGAALQFETRQFQERTGIACEVSVPSETFSLEPDRATGMFRAFQEMLTNVARHAQATRVTIALAQQGGSVILEVRDNGRGIREEELVDPNSLGLLGMKERASLMGGRIEVRGAAGAGTKVTLTIPVKPA